MTSLTSVSVGFFSESVNVQMVSRPVLISKSVIPALVAPKTGSVPGGVPVSVIGSVWMTHDTVSSFQVAGIASFRS